MKDLINADKARAKVISTKARQAWHSLTEAERDAVNHICNMIEKHIDNPGDKTFGDDPFAIDVNPVDNYDQYVVLEEYLVGPVPVPRRTPATRRFMEVFLGFHISYSTKTPRYVKVGW